MRHSSLAEWLSWQEKLHPSEIALGLERIKKVSCHLSFSGNKKIKTITVGGTNGKGSCVTYLESILLAAGYKVGAYTSPHLLRYNERVRINGIPVDDKTLCVSFERINEARKKTVEPVSLTYFEWGTLAALDIFSEQSVDIQILEVGLGGRLDAVNIIEPDAAIVVNVALDHEDWLGATREIIGVEKAGIFRKGIPLIIGEAEPPASILEAAKKLHNLPLVAKKDFYIESGKQSWSFVGKTINGNSVSWNDLPVGRLPLPSAACAVQAICSLDLAAPDAVKKGINTAHLAGRLQQVVWRERKLILDVAHNPAGAAYLIHQLQQQNIMPAAVVFSALDDKDIHSIMACLESLKCPFFMAALPAIRAATQEKLMRCARDCDLDAVLLPTIGDALKAASLHTRAAEVILICGSFYTVSEALSYIEKTV